MKSYMSTFIEKAKDLGKAFEPEKKTEETLSDATTTTL